MTTQQDDIIIEIAKSFIELFQQHMPSWRKGYYRFFAQPGTNGCTATYVVEGQTEAQFVDVFEHSTFLKEMRRKSLQLTHLMDLDQAVLLLVVTSDFDYEMNFEYNDFDRWNLTKEFGGTGVPEGFE